VTEYVGATPLKYKPGDTPWCLFDIFFSPTLITHYRNPARFDEAAHENAQPLNI
jgi:hypothetical protein